MSDQHYQKALRARIYEADEGFEWEVRDAANRELLGKSPRGYARIETAAANLSRVIGAEVNLSKRQGMYATGYVVGRAVVLDIVRTIRRQGLSA